MHYSIYQNAVHSMAAVGWIAPFVESIFYQSFRSVECEMKDGPSRFRAITYDGSAPQKISGTAIMYGRTADGALT